MSLKDFQTILVPAKETGSLHFFHKPTKAILEAAFSRPDVGATSGATVFDKDGILQELAENEPDWTFPLGGGCPKVLMRPQLQNLQNNSEPTTSPGTGFNTGVTFGANDWGIGLSGMVIYGDNSTFRNHTDNAGTINGDMTLAFIIKPDNGVQPTFGNTSGNIGQALISGVGNAPSSITDLGGGLFFVVVQGTANTGNSTCGVSKGTGNNAIGFEMSAIMLVAGAIDLAVTDYVKTVGGALTRSSNQFTLSNLVASGILGETEGTLIIKLDTPEFARLTADRMFTLGTSGNRIYLTRVNADPLRPRLYYEDSTGNHRAVIPDDLSTIGITWKNGVLFMSCNGVTLSFDNTGSGKALDLSGNSDLVISGVSASYGLYLSAFAPVALSESDLNAATA